MKMCVANVEVRMKRRSGRRARQVEQSRVHAISGEPRRFEWKGQMRKGREKIGRSSARDGGDEGNERISESET